MERYSCNYCWKEWDCEEAPTECPFCEWESIVKINTLYYDRSGEVKSL